MNFPDYDFQKMNEADVREEIIAPLLRHLGYRSGTKNNVIREQLLSYPNLFLGRKQKNDPILRGKADYICEADNQVRWVIEAKSPNSDLDQDVKEQSWSYASHPEIRAVYFCLMNGPELKLYQTNRGPEEPPIFECGYEQLKDSLTIIENLLAPNSILRDHPAQEVDSGYPIGPGLRSIVRIVTGSITYYDNSLKFAPLIGLSMSITSGSIERNEAGTLEAYIETRMPFESLQKLNEKLGLHSMKLLSEDSSIGTDPAAPIVFTSTSNYTFPQGEAVLNLMTWEESPFPMNMHIQTNTKVVGCLEGNSFQGEFTASTLYREVHREIDINGTFKISLA